LLNVINISIDYYSPTIETGLLEEIVYERRAEREDYDGTAGDEGARVRGKGRGMEKPLEQCWRWKLTKQYSWKRSCNNRCGFGSHFVRVFTHLFK